MIKRIVEEVCALLRNGDWVSRNQLLSGQDWETNYRRITLDVLVWSRIVRYDEEKGLQWIK